VAGGSEDDDDQLSDEEQRLKNKIFELMGDAAIDMDGMSHPYVLASRDVRVM
jgi:hypothetical protein